MGGAPDGTRYTYQHRMVRCTRPSCEKGCRTGIPSHGPYWYAYWREGDRVRSRYLGKHAPAGVVAAHQADPAPLHIQTLGDFAVWRGEERMPVQLWGPRMRALFALLLENVERPKTREQIADALWPELGQAAAAKAVRQTLARLRKVLDSADQQQSYLPGRKERITIDPAPQRPTSPLWWDVQTFRAATATALAGQDLDQGRTALAAYGGDYLPGEELPIVENQRTRLRDLYRTLLLHQVRIAATRADMAEAEACLKRLLTVDPVHEEAGRMLMLLLEQSGRRTEALKVYQDLACAVDEELGISPDAQTQRLAVILADQAQRAAPVLLPPSAPTPEQRGNLPHAAGSFVGRQTAREEIAALMHEQRLVTLSGVGGIGKSALALQIGHDLREQFPDGVWWVEFAGLPAATQTDDPSPALLAPALVQTLGIVQRPNQSIADTLEHFLQSRQLLLILDNCEHVRTPVAVLVSRLLGRCPDLHLLLTSRVRLDLPEEAIWPVPPFALPERGADLQTLAATEAVRFFVTRARAFSGGFRLETTTAGAVIQICRRLDGIPLALEFAAARMRLLEVDELAARLDDRFRLLSGTNPLALPRHQTLRATLDWSYALLAEPEQALLRRLAVFAGGWTLTAAATVCAARPLDTASILELLDVLVRHSLVLVDHRGSADETRYHMLETVREYGLLQLTTAKEQTAIAAAHRRWCLSLALQAEPQLRGHEQTRWFARLEIEHENLQAALAWSCAEPNYDPGREGLELAATIWQFWYHRSHYRVGRAWFDRLFAAFPPEVNVLSAKALNAAGGLAVHDDDLPVAKTFLQASLDTARQASDRRGAARALTNLAAASHSLGAYAEAEAWYEESLELFRELDDLPNQATALFRLGVVTKNRMRYSQAKTLLEDALARWQALGNRYTQCHILDALADIARRSGDLACADTLVDNAMVIAREIHFDPGIAYCLRTKAFIAKERGEYVTAARLLYESLDITFAERAVSNLADNLEDLAGVVAALLRRSTQSMGTAADAGPARRHAHSPSSSDGLWAVQLLGAAAAIRTSRGRPQDEEALGEYEADVRTLRQGVGDASFRAAWSNGTALAAEDAVALARQGRLHELDYTG
jgi:predicted ATPase/DNA-binding SARP family transcriptional activator